MIELIDKFEILVKKLFSKPASYIILILTLLKFSLFKNLDAISLKYFVPKEARKAVFQIIDVVYMPKVFFSIICLSAILMFLVYEEGSRDLFFFSHKDVVLTNGKTRSWDYNIAIARIKICLNIYLTVCWRWIFFFNVYFNRLNISNYLPKSLGSTDGFLTFMYNAFVILILPYNIFALYGFIKKRLFISDHDTDLNIVMKEDFSKYSCIYCTKIDNNPVGISVRKNSVEKKYYLFIKAENVVVSKHCEDDFPTNIKKPYYIIVNISSNLEEIKMQVTNMESGNLKIFKKNNDFYV